MHWNYSLISSYSHFLLYLPVELSSTILLLLVLLWVSIKASTLFTISESHSQRCPKMHWQSLLRTDLQKICDEIFAGQGDNVENRGIQCEVSLQNMGSQIQSALSILNEGQQSWEQDVEDDHTLHPAIWFTAIINDAKGPAVHLEVVRAAQYPRAIYCSVLQNVFNTVSRFTSLLSPMSVIFTIGEELSVNHWMR